MAVSKEEYLKRYLSGPTREEKKTKMKASKTANKKAGLKILDDDVDFKSLLPSNIQNSLDDDLPDDNPVVIDLGLDDRPKQMKELERMRNSKRWKIIAQDEDENLAASKVGEFKEEREATKNRLEHSVTSRSDKRDNEKKRYDSDSDASPARTANDKDTDQSISLPRNRLRADLESDASPVNLAQRERNGSGSETLTLKRKRRESESSSDNSPPRQRQDSTGSSDNSQKRRWQDSAVNTDNSPPRQMQGRRKRKDSSGSADNSPQQKQGRDRSSDNSPIRRKRKDFVGSADNSPPRRKHGRIPHSDNSPPKQKQGRNPVSDNSPLRRKRKGSVSSADNSPSRQRWNEHANSDNSPPRRKIGRKADSDSDISPPRKEDKSALDSSRQEQKKDKTDQRQDTTNYKVIYRKDGKKRDLQAEKKSKEEEDAKKAAMAAKYKEWNKGLKQKEIAKEHIADALHEAEKPLARYRDDQDLDARLRAQILAEDPMLAFIKKKKSKATGAEKPRYRGPQPPPNRFNIVPGYRWDGVDRSNGFEKKFFSKLSEDKARKDMAYKWSVEDM